MTTANKEQFWHKQYPDSIPHFIKPIDKNESLLTYIENTFKNHGPKTAFSFMDSNLSFSEVKQQAISLAKFFQHDLGLKKGDVVALQLPNIPQYPVALFACFYAGLSATNINPLYTTREMQYQLKASQAKLIIIFSAFTYKLETITGCGNLQSIISAQPGDALPFIKKHLVNFVFTKIKKLCPAFTISDLPIHSWEYSLKTSKDKKLNPVQLMAEDTAILQYTGGTTGASKGAVLSHKNILANIRQIQAYSQYTLDKNEVVITALPLYHIFAFTVNLFTFFEFGFKNVLISDPRNIPAFIKILNKHPWSIFTGVNTLMQALLNSPQFKSLSFKQVKICIVGGAALQTSVARQWKKETGIALAEGYGLTEASPVLCCNLLGHTKEKSIGLPLPSTEIKLMNDQGQAVAIGENGEIWAKGPQVMHSYLNNPEATNAAFDKQGSEAWLKTGDIAYQDKEGFIFIADRKKDMILVSGFNVFPNEVEDILSQHPKVAEVAVVGVPNSKSGESVRAHVIKKDPSLTELELIQFAKTNLVNYKVPRVIQFHTELPKTNIGKVLRRKLKNLP